MAEWLRPRRMIRCYYSCVSTLKIAHGWVIISKINDAGDYLSRSWSKLNNAKKRGHWYFRNIYPNVLPIFYEIGQCPVDCSLISDHVRLDVRVFTWYSARGPIYRPALCVNILMAGSAEGYRGVDIHYAGIFHGINFICKRVNWAIQLQVRSTI